MKLQQLIDQTDLDMSIPEVKAFFLGVLTAEKPLPFPKALSELLTDTPEAKSALEPDLKKLWEELQSNTKKELANMFPEDSSLSQQIDYFLTGMSLSGTNPESCKSEELTELMEELESLIAEFDEAEGDDAEAELKASLNEVWDEFLLTKK